MWFTQPNNWGFLVAPAVAHVIAKCYKYGCTAGCCGTRADSCTSGDESVVIEIGDTDKPVAEVADVDMSIADEF